MFSRQFWPENYFPYVYWTGNQDGGVEFQGSAVLSYSVEGNQWLRVHKFKADWVTGSDGTLEIPAPKEYGFLLKIVTIPSASMAPALGYDIDMIGEDGIDVLGGAAHNLDSVNKEEVYPTMNASMTPVMTCGDHTLRISGTGGPAAGRAVLYFVESLGKKNVA